MTRSGPSTTSLGRRVCREAALVLEAALRGALGGASGVEGEERGWEKGSGMERRGGRNTALLGRRVSAGAPFQKRVSILTSPYTTHRSNPFDIFESFFGGMGGGNPFSDAFGGGASRGGPRPPQPVPGDDRGVSLQVDFAEAVFGCNKEVEVNHLEACATCTGTGVKPGTKSSTCKTCGGQGQVVQAVRTPLGMFQQVAPCPTCHGTGQESTPCSTCAGDGRVRTRKKISLRVPAGIDTGARLRVRGEGDAGKRCDDVW